MNTVNAISFYNKTYLQDLVPEDVMMLDSGAEIYIWIGNEANNDEKEKALEIAKVTKGASIIDVHSIGEGGGQPKVDYSSK